MAETERHPDRPDRRRLVAVVAVVVALVLTTVLALTREPVNRVLSDQIAQRLGLQTVRGELSTRIADLKADIAARDERIRSLEARMDQAGAEHAALQDRLALETERGDALSKALAGERGLALGNVERVIATRERTLERIAKRRALEEAQARANALPWFGAVAIADDLRQRQAEDCALLRDMDSLEQAIAGSAPGAEATDRVCLADEPAADALWAAVRNDPLAGWNALRTAGRDLPDISVDGPLGFLLETIDGLGAWLQPDSDGTE